MQHTVSIQSAVTDKRGLWQTLTSEEQNIINDYYLKCTESSDQGHDINVLSTDILSSVSCIRLVLVVVVPFFMVVEDIFPSTTGQDLTAVGS